MVNIIGNSVNRVRKPKTKAKPHTNSPKILSPTATSPLNPKGAGNVLQCLRNAAVCRGRGSQRSNRTRDVMPTKGGMPLYSQPLGIIILLFSYRIILSFYVVQLVVRINHTIHKGVAVCD